MDYKVGYRKPPTATQFKPGQSGNPKGRGKGAKNLSTLFQAIGNERVPVTENGKKRTMTKAECVARRLFTKALNGDHTAMRQLFPILQKIEEDMAVRAQQSTHYLSEERKVALRERLKESAKTLISSEEQSEAKAEGNDATE